MLRYEKRFWILAAWLAALAGYVDAVGFIKLGGFFVSFMSGNSTRLAVGLVRDVRAAAVAGSLVGSFLVGVIGGALVAARAGVWRKPAVLGTVAGVLAVAAAMDAVWGGRAPALLMAAAMGAENAVFLRDGEVTIGVTYMTGALVKLGQRAAAALQGGARWGWVPYLMLWGSLTAGAVIGATVWAWAGGMAIWGAAAAAAVLALHAARMGPVAV